MKFQHTTALASAALIGFAAAEVPQEHSHEKYLRAVNELLAQSNPLNIQDAVFGLLGNAAAEEGAGDVTNLDCLHQITADSAFTTAKAANDIDGQANALIFRAIERNTGSVGLKSVLCDETAENPEIAALSQHQDPASENAAEENKAITLALAQQLSLIGADPLLALESGTFAPGDPDDATGAGNTCNELDDAEGCIFTQNLLVEDATPEEIQAAVDDVAGGNAGIDAGAGAGSNETAVSNSTSIASRNLRRHSKRAFIKRSRVFKRAVDADADADASSNATSIADKFRRQSSNGGDVANNSTGNGNNNDDANNADDDDNADDAANDNANNNNDNNDNANDNGNADDAATGTSDIQTFTGDLGGPAPPVTSSAASDKPFEVNGSTFVNAGAALQRSCAVQNNACADAANSGAEDISVDDCAAQEDECLAAASLKKFRRSSTVGSAGRKMRMARNVAY